MNTATPSPFCTLKTVQTAQDEQRFLDCARYIYADDAQYVCPLDREVRKVFSPTHNPNFTDGKAQRWIAINPDGIVVGRIAAFYSQKRAAKFDIPTGGMGFFECIDEYAVAEQLFIAAKGWLQSAGMAACLAPINYGETDQFWGLLTSGFTTPAYGMPYNPPYYQQFFERFGFGVHYKQLSRRLDISVRLPERFYTIAERVKSKHNIRLEIFNPKDLNRFADDFVTIYNDAWQHNPNFTPLKREQVLHTVNEIAPIALPEMIIFAYSGNEPAGFIFCLPDLNQIIKAWNGKVTFWEGIKFLWRKRNRYEWYRKRGILNAGRLIIMGIRPQFQKQGLESALSLHSYDIVREMGFKYIELSWVGDFNPLMLALIEATGAPQSHEHITYELTF